MILDTLENANRYKALHPGFAEAVDFMQRPDLKDLEEGRHEINGDHVYALVIRKFGKKKEDGLIEIHRKYIDIQVVLGGTDEIGWKPTPLCTGPEKDYDPEADIQFFTDPPDAWVATHPGQFAVFFPEDAHMPMISPDELHKVVIKVALAPT